MSIQEKIDRLALAALHSAPSRSTRPEPTTFMLPFEKPGRVAIVESSAGIRDARFGGSSRQPQEAAALVSRSWPFGAGELRL